MSITRDVGDAPFPEAVTAGRLLRLLGGSFLVGVAETEPMAAKAERRAPVFIVNGLDVA